jgi:hypothetical protein
MPNMPKADLTAEADEEPAKIEAEPKAQAAIKRPSPVNNRNNMRQRSATRPAYQR